MVLKTFTCLALCAALLACGEKAELNRRMEALCKVDGGMKIYEKVVLPPQMFDQNNNVRTSTTKEDGKYKTIIADAFIEKHQLTVIKGGDPLKEEGLLHREHLQIIRLNDDKVMAELVLYIRAGGDGFHMGHHSVSECPLVEGGLNPKVFSKQESR